MKWLTNLFRPRGVSSINGAVIFLDIDLLSKEEVERIKQRMTPVFVEHSGHRTKMRAVDVRRVVVQS